MKQIKVLLVTCLCFFSFHARAIGTGDWYKITPGGNTMSDPGSGTWLQLKQTNEKVFPVEEWYFYKGNIIGRSNIFFFVADESSGSVTRFQTESEWKAFIEKNNFKPAIWTRWYSDNWMDIDAVLIVMLFGFFISIPLLILLIWITYKAIVKDHFRLSSTYTKILLAVTLILSTVVLLDYYPMSI